MTWVFVFVVLWLNTGGANLEPETHVVAALSGACDDQDFRAAAIHAAIEQSDHPDQAVDADVWCDTADAPASDMAPEPAPPEKPAKHVPGDGEV